MYAPMWERLRCWTVFMAAIVFAAVLSSPVKAEVIDPFYSGSYTLTDLGAPLGIPGPLGGLTFFDLDTLLIGGSANVSSGAIYSIGVTRDGSGHITAFSGPASPFATAPQIDGGLVYGPGGVLFFTGYPTNELGQIKPGSGSPDKTIDLNSAPAVSSSVGAVQFAPNGAFKIASYNTNDFYTGTLSPDGLGTYDLTSTTYHTTLEGGVEGFIYVPPGSPLFPTSSMLVAEWSAGNVVSYEVDASYNPIYSTRKLFIDGLSGAEGSVIDPLTGDFLFSTFGGGDHVDIVTGFVPPPPPPTGEVPEPATMLLLGFGLAGLAGVRRKLS